MGASQTALARKRSRIQKEESDPERHERQKRQKEAERGRKRQKEAERKL
jgi:hypothetical protein